MQHGGGGGWGQADQLSQLKGWDHGDLEVGRWASEGCVRVSIYIHVEFSDIAF